MVGSFARSLQDRRQRPGGSSLGQTQEPTGYELRQTKPLHPPVLPEGHHEEDGTLAAARLPVLPPVRSLTAPTAYYHSFKLCLGGGGIFCCYKMIMYMPMALSLFLNPVPTNVSPSYTKQQRNSAKKQTNKQKYVSAEGNFCV